MKVEDRIIELLDSGYTFDETRDQICKKYNLNHGNYKHLFYLARQKMLKREAEND